MTVYVVQDESKSREALFKRFDEKLFVFTDEKAALKMAKDLGYPLGMGVNLFPGVKNQYSEGELTVTIMAVETRP